MQAFEGSLARCLLPGSFFAALASPGVCVPRVGSILGSEGESQDAAQGVARLVPSSQDAQGTSMPAPGTAPSCHRFPEHLGTPSQCCLSAWWCCCTKTRKVWFQAWCGVLALGYPWGFSHWFVRGWDSLLALLVGQGGRLGLSQLLLSLPTCLVHRHGGNSDFRQRFGGRQRPGCVTRAGEVLHLSIFPHSL